MWSFISRNTWSAFKEISIRLLLLLILYVLYLKFQPHKHYITEAELHPDYKRPPKESRVTMQTVMILIIVIPLVVISSQLLIRNYEDVLQGLLGWNLALIVNAVTTEALKLVVCRPRPDFFYRCFPDSKMTEDLHCTGNEAVVIDGRKSFPSGHSSFSFCSLGFLTLWLTWKMRERTCGRFVAFGVRFMPLLIASVICATRVCDNRHHWQDVLGGSIIGLLIAYLSYNHYCLPLETQFNVPRNNEELCACLTSPQLTSTNSSKHSVLSRHYSKTYSSCNKEID